MRNALGTGVLAAVGTAMAAACGGDGNPGDRRVFRDNFDSLASGWEVSEGATVEGGFLRLTAGVDASPEATYTFPTPYGPGWELETSINLVAGLACASIQVYAGDVRRHTWALGIGFRPDSAATLFEWSLQVGDGPDAWETVGVAPGVQETALGPVQNKMRVSEGNVTVWIQDAEVLSETVLEASQEVVSVKLEASRCRIRAGAVTVDWIQLSELGS